jgi:hypothetical protein
METGLLFRKFPEMFSEKFIGQGVKSLRPIELDENHVPPNRRVSPSTTPITQVGKDSVAEAQQDVRRIGKNKATVRTKKSMDSNRGRQED